MLRSEQLSILQEVLDMAHRGHRYISDAEQYGAHEYWRESLVGDCEDFALWCRARLAERGIASDLIFCGVTNPAGDHLVCSVEGWILDNRYRWVRSRDQLAYTWLKIGKPDGRWYAIAQV